MWQQTGYRKRDRIWHSWLPPFPYPSQARYGLIPITSQHTCMLFVCFHPFHSPLPFLSPILPSYILWHAPLILHMLRPVRTNRAKKRYIEVLIVPMRCKKINFIFKTLVMTEGHEGLRWCVAVCTVFLELTGGSAQSIIYIPNIGLWNCEPQDSLYVGTVGQTIMKAATYSMILP